MYCRHCGKQLPDTANFCDNCGAKTAVAQPTRPTQPQPPVQPQKPVQPTQVSQPVQTYTATNVRQTKRPPKKPKRWLTVLALLFCALLFVSTYSDMSLPEIITAVKLGEPLTKRGHYDLRNAVSERKSSVTVRKSNWDEEVCQWSQIESFLSDYFQADPELFFVDIRNTQLVYPETENPSYYTVQIAYFDELTTEKAAQKMEAIADKFISSIPAGSSDWEKALHLHDKLIRHVTYKDGKLDQTAYGALVKGEAVCMGYAMAYEYLLEKAGIECDTVIGYSDELSAAMDGTFLQEDQHAWSIVTFEENGERLSYYVDTTWDDLDKSDIYGKDYVSRQWFCVTQQDIDKEGRVIVDKIYDTGKWKLDDDTLNYYVFTDRVIDSYDYYEVLSIMKEQYLEGNNYLSLRVANLETYYDLKYAIESGGDGSSLCDDLGVDTFNYSFTYDYQDDGLICFEIYLNYPEE